MSKHYEKTENQPREPEIWIIDQLNQSVPLSETKYVAFSNNNNSFLTESTTVDSYTHDTSTDSQLAQRVAVGILLSLFILFAIAGNLLVIVAVLTDRHLRHTGNYFIVSLALADTLVAVAVMTFAVVNDVLGRWVFGSVFCDVWVSADVMCSTASILNLCSISADRYLHVRSPLRYDVLMTHRRALLVIALVWVLSALISFLPIQLGLHRALPVSDLDPTATTPEDFNDDKCLMDLNPYYAIVSSIISFYLPCMAMIFVYVKLHRYAARHAESIRNTYRYSQPSGSYTTVPSSSNLAHNDTSSADLCRTASSSTTGSYKMSDHKAAITLGIIMGVFLVCWTPFFSINIVVAFCRGACSVPPTVFAVFTWLGYLNSTMNPVIYGIFNRQFRDAFGRILLHRRCWTRNRSGGHHPNHNQHQPMRPALRPRSASAIPPLTYTATDGSCDGSVNGGVYLRPTYGRAGTEYRPVSLQIAKTDDDIFLHSTNF